MNCEWFFTFISMECTALYLALFAIVKENSYVTTECDISSRDKTVLYIVCTKINIRKLGIDIYLSVLYNQACLRLRGTYTNY